MSSIELNNMNNIFKEAIKLLNENGYEVIKLSSNNIESYSDIFFKIIKFLNCKLREANIVYDETGQPNLFKIEMWLPNLMS